jgi:hypothetical protein
LNWFYRFSDSLFKDKQLINPKPFRKCNDFKKSYSQHEYNRIEREIQQILFDIQSDRKIANWVIFAAVMMWVSI